MVKGIERRRQGIGSAMIRIPFRSLRFVICMDFLMISEEVPSLPSLPSMRDTIDNGPEISLQGRYASFAGN